MKKLFRYVKPYWLLAVLSPLLMLGEVFVDLLQPKMMATIINDGAIGGDMSVIWKTGAFMLITVILGAAAGIGCAITATTTSQNFGTDLRIDAYKKVMGMSLQQTDKFSTGSIVTRMTNDISLIQDVVAMVLRMFVRAPLLFIGGIIMVVSLNLKFGLVLIAAIPIQIIVTFFIVKKANPLFNDVQNKLDKVNAVVQENVSGARVVKAYVKEEYEMLRFESANNELKGKMQKVLILMSVITPVFMIAMNGVLIAILLIGGGEVQANAAALGASVGMKVGDVMSAITYVTQILMSMMMMSMIFQVWSRAEASAKRVSELLECERVIVGGEIREKEISGAISFKNVSFKYPEAVGNPVLSSVNLDIKPGETIAVVGATGSGKSSFVNLIPRFYDVTEGEVLIDGVNIKEYDLETLRSQIAIVLQKSELFSATIAENIKWGKPDASEKDVLTAAKIAQADDFISEFAEGYGTYIAEKGASLSGGQKQRLSIARAIIKTPKVLIFDDSTSALDLSTETKLQKAIKEELRDMTIIIVAQRIASVRDADRIAVIENSTITHCAPHGELIKISSAYRDIYNSQMKNGGGVNE